jgi:hypothetical protein
MKAASTAVVEIRTGVTYQRPPSYVNLVFPLGTEIAA